MEQLLDYILFPGNRSQTIYPSDTNYSSMIPAISKIRSDIAIIHKATGLDPDDAMSLEELETLICNIDNWINHARKHAREAHNESSK